MSTDSSSESSSQSPTIRYFPVSSFSLWWSPSFAFILASLLISHVSWRVLEASHVVWCECNCGEIVPLCIAKSLAWYRMKSMDCGSLIDIEHVRLNNNKFTSLSLLGQFSGRTNVVCSFLANWKWSSLGTRKLSWQQQFWLQKFRFLETVYRESVCLSHTTLRQTGDWDARRCSLIPSVSSSVLFSICEFSTPEC